MNAIGATIYTPLVLFLGIYLGFIITDYCNNNNKEDKK